MNILPNTAELSAFSVHTLIAVGIFFSVNWLGRHSMILGYEYPTSLSDRGETTSFNILFRVATPLALLVVISAILYKLKLDRFVANIDRSILIYIFVRFTFNVARGHFLLIPWKRVIIQWISLIALSGWLYRDLISKKSFLFPDASTLGSELWLAVGAYIYALASKIPIKPRKTDRYIDTHLHSFREMYGSILEAARLPSALQVLAYGIMLIENYNRPPLARSLERFAFRFGKAKTFGIMQVRGKTPLSDTESVSIGSKLLFQCYLDALEKRDDWEASDYAKERYSASNVISIEEGHLIHQTLTRYNPSGDYARAIEELIPDVKKFLFSEDIILHPQFLQLEKKVKFKNEAKR